MKTIKALFFCLLLVLLHNCGSSPIISTPEENIDNIPLKISNLSDSELKKWSHLDLTKDTIPGISLEKAYSEIIKTNKGVTTIVAVIDSGVDINHEDLSSSIWVNTKEIPNNGKDDDNNGFIDDVNGWNFIGDTYDEQFEFVRLIVSGDSSNPRYADALFEYQKQYQKYTEAKTNTENLIQQVTTADNRISSYLKKKNYTKEDVFAIRTEDQNVLEAVSIMRSVYTYNFETVDAIKAALNKDLKLINERLTVHLNKNLKGRKTKDNPNDINDIGYGDNNVKPHDAEETHGTHVSGIIAAKRDNNKGIKGVANNVKIMPIRNTPNGDEYDKDIALAIRYAVDNGAKIINMSFGKYFSPHKEWVKDAILYAASNDVLIVHAAGNDALNLDSSLNFPTDVDNGKEIADNFINVGATYYRYGSDLVADYSNYGKQNVDIFAPGSSIYSTVPNNSYESEGGTSMAAPLVTGVAALIRSQYPNLTASQVKKAILNSGLEINTKVIVGGNIGDIKSFDTLSKSGKLLNAYNALLEASKLNNN